MVKLAKGKTSRVSNVSNRANDTFRDFGGLTADLLHLKASLAAEIIEILDCDKLTTRSAHALTGTSAADFSRIRNANLGRFKVDRLIAILESFGAQVKFDVRVTRR